MKVKKCVGDGHVGEDNIKIDLRERGYQSGICTEVAQEHVHATITYK